MQAVITFRLTFREYIHESKVNLKPAFLTAKANVRALENSFCHHVGAALERTQKKSLPRICSGSSLGLAGATKSVGSRSVA